MSQENNERRPREQRQPSRPTEDLERKGIEVDEKLYHIEMKQNGDSRFMRIIEDPSLNGRTRVVIPMCVASEVLKRIRDTIVFCSTYSPKNLSAIKSANGRPESPHSLYYISPGGRRYYFDVIDANNSVCLRISYIFGRRRETVQMVDTALSKLLEILESYRDNYPSISPTDDYPLSRNRNFAPRRFSDRRFNNNNQRPRNFRPRNQYTNSPTSPNEASENRRANALHVVSDPAPATFNSNTKRFTVEIVEGVNTFFRITETINEKRKSTLHVPVEVAPKLQSVLSEMNRKYAQKPPPVNPPSGSAKA